MLAASSTPGVAPKSALVLLVAALRETAKIIGMIFGAFVVAALVLTVSGSQPLAHSVGGLVLGGLCCWAWVCKRKVRAAVLGVFAAIMAIAALAPPPTPEQLAQREAANQARQAEATGKAERQAQERQEIERKRREDEALIARLEAEQRRAAKQRAELQEQNRREALAAAVAGERLRQLAIEQVRGMMRNPDSAHFSDVRVVTSRGGGRVLAVCGSVSSTNGFGARVSSPFLLSTESDHVYIKGPDGWSGSGLSLWSQHCS